MYTRTPLSQILPRYGITGVHPLADVFPMCTDEEFQEICKDVEKNGFQQPVKITTKNLLIDGRNRIEIAHAVEIEPSIEYKDVKDVLGYIMSENLHRRHLTPGQKAMIAEKIANLPKGRHVSIETSILSKRAVANKVGTSPASISRARTIRKLAPEEAKQVEAGKMTMEQGYQAARRKKRNGTTATKKSPLERQREALENAPGLNGGLSPMQVDPELADKPFEFTAKYGFVNLHTKKQIETDRDKAAFSQWLGAIKKLHLPLIELLKIGAFNQSNVQNWIRRASDPSKFPARYAEIYEMVSVIKQAGDSVTGLLEWLNTHKVD